MFYYYHSMEMNKNIICLFNGISLTKRMYIINKFLWKVINNNMFVNALGWCIGWNKRNYYYKINSFILFSRHLSGIFFVFVFDILIWSQIVEIWKFIGKRKINSYGQLQLLINLFIFLNWHFKIAVRKNRFFCCSPPYFISSFVYIYKKIAPFPLFNRIYNWICMLIRFKYFEEKKIISISV